MTRALIVLLSLTVLGSLATADCIVIKRGGKLQVLGMPAQVGGVDVTPENVDLYSDQSVGAIESEGYDIVAFKKTDKSKAETFPRSEVVRTFYNSEPDGLVSGYAEMAAGNYLAALSQFKTVTDDPNARDVYKYQALRQIGLCYYALGRTADCIKHYEAWPAVNAVQTPIVYRFLADLLTEQRKYDAARAKYDEISKLPGIPDVWKFNARLGGVKVDTAERKFDDAERGAAAIARETQGKADVIDANVLALVLQAEAIWRGGKTERFPEAEAILTKASSIEGAENGTRAFLFVTLGNVLYAQGKVEEARFPYMRAALMYPNTGYEGLAYFNAGQCFLDMSGRLDGGKDQEKSDDYLVKGMRLLGTAAGNYRVADAAKRYRENKKRFDDVLAKMGEKEEGEAEKPEEKPQDDKSGG
jgi:tetratricopeptide (TPR) repeat protein